MTPLQDIEKGKLFTFKAPLEELTGIGVDKVEAWLADNFRVYVMLDVVIGTKQTMTIDYDDYTLRGKLFSRIEQYLRHRHNRSMTQEQSSELGTLIAQNMLGGSEINYFDVVDFIRWRPGSFGESTTSCWWSMYRYGKQLFINEMERGEAVAIRLFRPATFQEHNTRGLKKWYKNYVGVGRCFAVVNNPVDYDIVFNTYGLNVDQWQSLLMSIFGYDQARDIRLRLADHTFVNRGAGLALSKQPINFDRYSEPYFGVYSPIYCPVCSVKQRRLPHRFGDKRCLSCINKQSLQQHETAVSTL